MRNKFWTLSAAVMLAASIGGCGNDTTPPAATPTPPSAPTPPAPPAAPTPAAPAAETPATPAPTPVAPVAPPAPAAPTAATPTQATATAAAETEANTLIQQATQYVKDNKLDLADQALTKLQGMKSSLPAEYGPKIDELKALVDAAKLKSGSLPGGMKMPGM